MYATIFFRFPQIPDIISMFQNFFNFYERTHIFLKKYKKAEKIKQGAGLKIFRTLFFFINQVPTFYPIKMLHTCVHFFEKFAHLDANKNELKNYVKSIRWKNCNNCIYACNKIKKVHNIMHLTVVFSVFLLFSSF